jgi:polyferredoxin
VKRRQKIRYGIVFGIFLLFPIIINYLSPYLIIEGAGEGIVSGSFMVFGILLISSLFFGRAWCGWLCPASGMQDACVPFTSKKARTGTGNIVKFAIWFAWLGLIVFMFIKAGGLKKVDFLYRSEEIISILNPIVVFVYVFVIIIIVSMVLIWGQRSFCKYLCWMGPFMIIGNKLRHWLNIPGLYLKGENEKCIDCKRCSRECPMDIDVMELVKKQNMYSSECIMCFNCADVCPKGVISTGTLPTLRKGENK